MKVFLSWSPKPPDPPFWKWMPVDGIVVSIALLKQRKLLKHIILSGIHDFLDFNGHILLDSGSYEDSITNNKLRPNSPTELLTLADWLGADLVAHLDTPFVGKNAMLLEEEKWNLLKQNILNAIISYKWAKRKKSKMKVIYVIQGWNHESIEYCCKELSKLNADYYALGSLVGLHPNEIISRARLVREIIGDGPKLHLFAVSNLEVIKKVKSFVDSVDSSTASIAGAMKEIIRPSGRRVHINKAFKQKCSCPVCNKHKGAIFVLGKVGTQNYFNQLRKVHNAFQLLRNIRAIIDGENSKH